MIKPISSFSIKFFAFWTDGSPFVCFIRPIESFSPVHQGEDFGDDFTRLTCLHLTCHPIGLFGNKPRLVQVRTVNPTENDTN